MRTIVCVKWGQRYDDYVEKLKANCEKYGTFDRFYCLTDRPEKNYELPLPTHWDKHFTGPFWAYRKCYMFNEDLFDIEGDEFLFFDLDVLFHKSIDSFWELDMSNPWIVRGWWNDIANCRKNYGKIMSTPLNSSVIRWNRGQLKPVYEHIDTHAEYVFFSYRTIDNYFNHHWYNHLDENDGFFKGFEPGLVYSYYKGNIFPTDMELKKIRPDHTVCLFNNSASGVHEDMWEIEEIRKLW